MIARRKEDLKKLQNLSPRSDEFRAIASTYYYNRLRGFRSAGLFFFVLGTLSTLAGFVLIWDGRIIIGLAECVGGIIFTIGGRFLFLLGKHGIRMIKSAQKIDLLTQKREVIEQRLAVPEPEAFTNQQNPQEDLQLDAIRQFAGGIFRRDEISETILKRIDDERSAA